MAKMSGWRHLTMSTNSVQQVYYFYTKIVDALTDTTSAQLTASLGTLSDLITHVRTQTSLSSCPAASANAPACRWNTPFKAAQ